MTRHHLICDVTCDMCYVTCVFLISKKMMLLLSPFVLLQHGGASENVNERRETFRVYEQKIQDRFFDLQGHAASLYYS